MANDVLWTLLKRLIQTGVVIEVNYPDKLVRVQFDDIKSGWMRWGVGRAGSDIDWRPPQVGEQVVVLMPYGDEAKGIIVASLYSESFVAPSDSGDKQIAKFKDGSVIEYDSAAKKLSLNLTGEAQININGNASINVGGEAKVNAVGEASIDASAIKLNGGSNGGVVCQQHVCAFTGSPHPQASSEVSAT